MGVVSPGPGTTRVLLQPPRYYKFSVLFARFCSALQRRGGCCKFKRPLRMSRLSARRLVRLWIWVSRVRIPSPTLVLSFLFEHILGVSTGGRQCGSEVLGDVVPVPRQGRNWYRRYLPNHLRLPKISPPKAQRFGRRSHRGPDLHLGKYNSPESRGEVSARHCAGAVWPLATTATGVWTTRKRPTKRVNVRCDRGPDHCGEFGEILGWIMARAEEGAR